MTKQQIQKELFSRYYSFVDFINSLDEADFSFAFGNKWTAPDDQN
jgi:hypothetical protein